MNDHIITRTSIDIAIASLKYLQNEEIMTDTEQNHIDADNIVLNLLPKEIQTEFYKIHMWYA